MKLLFKREWDRLHSGFFGHEVSLMKANRLNGSTKFIITIAFLIQNTSPVKTKNALTEYQIRAVLP